MNSLLSQFKQHLKKYGVPAKIDGIDTRVFFKEYNDNVNPLDNKYLFSYPINLIKQGSIIECLNTKWIVVSKPNNINEAYDKSIVREVNFNINFNFNGTIRKFPSIIDTKVFDLTESKYFVVSNDKIFVTLADTIENRQIYIAQRFLIMGKAWKVTGIDKSKKGLIILNAEITEFDTNDDTENEIPNKPNPHIYTIETTNTDITIEQCKTLQFNVIVKDNRTAIVNPTIIYTSNNTNCSVDSNGLITAKTEGISTITATYTAPDGTVKSVHINITVVKPVVVDNYTLSISGADSVKAGYTDNFTAIIKNNNVEVTDQKVTWELLSGTNPVSNTIAELTNITDRTVTVSAKTEGEYIILKATLNVDSSKNITKQIYIKGLW